MALTHNDNGSVKFGNSKNGTAIALFDSEGNQLSGGARRVTTTPTLTVAGSYATGDYIGPSATPASFASAVPVAAGITTIQSLLIVDKVVTAAVALELWLFSATFVAPTDNAAWTVTDAEALTCVGVIPITTDKWFLGTVNKIYTDPNIGLIVACAATSLFFALVARGTTPTWADGDLAITVGLL